MHFANATKNLAYLRHNGIITRSFGAVAQLGERRVRNAKVRGSSPRRSTKINNLQMNPGNWSGFL